MIIPFLTQRNRLLITLTISAQRPMNLGIVAYDPENPNTHYLRRKAPVDNFREIRLQLPLTPNKLLLELYNKETGTDRDFSLEDMTIEPMKEADVWAAPERHRFMDFAMRFAQRAGYVGPGFFHSPEYEFLIHYLPTITDERGKELITPARIHRHMPRVQLSQRLFRQFSIPVRVAILAHEGCHYFNNTRSEREADLCGIRYYLEYGFPSIEGIYAATKVFLKHPETVSDVHIERAKDIEQFIRQYKQNQWTNESR